MWVALLGCHGTPVHNLAAAPDPTGVDAETEVNGVAFGDVIGRRPDAADFRMVVTGDGTRVFTREREVLVWKGVPVEAIEYHEALPDAGIGKFLVRATPRSCSDLREAIVTAWGPALSPTLPMWPGSSGYAQFSSGPSCFVAFQNQAFGDQQEERVRAIGP